MTERFDLARLHRTESNQDVTPGDPSRSATPTPPCVHRPPSPSALRGLALASQVVIASEDTVFTQMEVVRGIVPLGGATFRLGARLGAGGIRWLLTGEKWNAQDALAAGLVSEVVPAGEQLNRAIELAEMIARNAPLAVRSALAGHRAAERAARNAAAAKLREDAPRILSSDDVTEGVKAMLERRNPVYQGR